MKSIISTVMCLVLLAALATGVMAGQTRNNYTAQPFVSFTGSNGNLRYSGIYRVGDQNTSKTFAFQGYSTEGSITATTNGTVAAYCAPTANGPWLVHKDINGNTVSTTANAIYNLETLCRFVKFGFTRSTSRPKSISTWILFAD